MSNNMRELNNTELNQIAGGMPIGPIGRAPVIDGPIWGDGSPYGGVVLGGSAYGGVGGGGSVWWKPVPGKP